MKFAFLTGAGASYGAGRLLPKPPPLGVGLYEDLASEFPDSWGNLPSECVGALQRDFEQGMLLVWDDHLGLVQRLMIDMARYFSRFDPPADRSDCYSRLAAAIVSHGLADKTAFGTLNYECALDVAACRMGLKISYAGWPPAADNLMIWKLHGSCNLLPKAHVYDMTIVGSNIYQGPIEAVDMPVVRERYEHGLAIPPVMCVYMPGKPTQTMWEFLRQVRQEWADWVRESDVVVVIGARPILEEDYVWQPMADSNAEVWYMGGADGDYKRFRSRLAGRMTHLASTFEDGIEALVARLQATGRGAARPGR